MKKFFRFLYQLLWLFVLPSALLRLLLRARHDIGYRQHIAERLGFYSISQNRGFTRTCLWIHAVSVGETRAAEPLVEALLTAQPGLSIWLTHMTPTGRRTGAMLFASHIANGRLYQSYMPYDIACLVRRFFRHSRPCMGLLMETEVWPNTVWEAQQFNIPLVLVNARMSARSFQRARYFGFMAEHLFAALPLALAQTPADAKRLQELGVPEVHVCGNLKFDMPIAFDQAQYGASLHRQIGVERRVFCAASTRPGEEALILDAWRQLQKQFSWAINALLIIVPRHPQRVPAIADEIRQRGFSLALRSNLFSSVTVPAPSRKDLDIQALGAEIQVLLGDSLGEMALYYGACDCALIGGSLLPFGGQNLIEACALGKPVLLGPHMFNFTQASADAIQIGAALQIPADENLNADTLSRYIAAFFNEPNRLPKMSTAAYQFAHTYRGATVTMMQKLLPYLPQ